MPTTETEARMVMAHKQGCKKARLGFHHEFIVDVARLLPTEDERVAFIEREKLRMAERKSK